MSLPERLGELEAAGLRRELRVGAGVPLASNDYLGLAADPAVRGALAAALAAGVPTGAGGSRLLGGHHPAHAALEDRFAAWQGAEAALLYGSGFAANQGLLGAVVEREALVVSDALNHASLIDGLRLARAARRIVPHLDVDAYAAALEPGRPTYVVVESVYSMDGDLAPLEDLAQLCTDRGARLIVDEAHATGLYGPTGAGRIQAAGVREAVFASVHPAGKALGSAGAVVVGSADLRELQINRARTFVYSTAPPPFLTAGLDAAIDRITADPDLRARPLALAARLRAGLAGVPAQVRGANSPIVPVVVGEVARGQALAEGLRARGWDAPVVRPPTVPEGTTRLRLVMHAGLLPAQVDALAGDLRDLL